MNYVIVCECPGPEYPLAVVIGLAAVAALWVLHRRAARRAGARQILPLKDAGSGLLDVVRRTA